MDDASPALRAITEAGETWDPSPEQLLALLETLQAEESDFLIIERTADPTGETYAQSALDPDGCFLVEYRAGDSEHHYCTTAADLRSAWELLAGWAADRPGWREQASWSLLQVDDADSPPDTELNPPPRRRSWPRRPQGLPQRRRRHRPPAP